MPFSPTPLGVGSVQTYTPQPLTTNSMLGSSPVPYTLGSDGAIHQGSPISSGPTDCGPDCCSDGCCGSILSGPCNWFHNLCDGCCCAANGCQLPRFWGGAEYLLWTIRNMNVPPLVSAAPSGVSPDLISGQSIYGPGTLSQGTFSGGRFTAGFSLGCMPNLGFEASYFYLGRRTRDFTAGSDGMEGSPNLGRPIVLPGGNETAELVASTGVLRGATAVSSGTELWGTEANLKRRLLCGCNGYLDLLGGFRYLDLREQLRVNENLISLVPLGTPAVPAGTQTLITDYFGTTNQFYGGQLGLAGEYRFWKKVLRWRLHQGGDGRYARASEH